MDTRRRLIAATIELFRSRGFHGTSLSAVTAASAAPVGSLYHFFPGGKSELAAAALADSGAAYLGLFDLITTNVDRLPEALEAFFDGAAETLVECDYIEICPIGAVAREVASSDETIRAATDAVFSSWITVLAARFHGAGLPDDEAESLATTVIATLEGAFGLARTRRDADLVRAAGRHMGQLATLALASSVEITAAESPSDVPA